ncbi:MAG: response regulator [Desulfobacteraceae bacterium]|nr:MAG: response regulator [Desulfobacteraceae bacterium]
MIQHLFTVIFTTMAISGFFTLPATFAEEVPDEVTAIALRNWPPHYRTDPKTGEPAGFAIDVMNRISRMSGIRIRYVTYANWPDAFAALENGKAVLVPNLGITDERLRLYDFTLPYETFRISIFIRDSTVDIQEQGDIYGRKVAVVRKNQGHVLMEEKGGSDLRIYNSVGEAFMALLSGNVEALVYPEQLITEIAIRSGLEDQIRIVGKPLQEVKRAMAVRKGHPELFGKLDNAVRQFVETPEYKTMYEKWFGRPEPFWNGFRVAAVMGVVMVLAITGILAWRYVSILRLNRSLTEAEKRFRGIVENSNAGYFFVDTKGRFRNVNQAWLKMHGYDSSDEVIGQHFTLTQVEADLVTTGQNVEKLLAGISIPTGEASRRCKDGSVGYHTFSAQPVVIQGKVAGLEGFIIDTNERRRFEAQTRLAQKTKSLGRMAGAIAHHYNNLMAIMMGNLELALEDLPGDSVMIRELEEAMFAARRASRLSTLMLAYLGQTAALRESMDLSRACREFLPELRAGMPKHLTLETDLPEPGPIIRANAGEIRQILENLVINAREAMGEQPGVISLSVGNVLPADIPFTNRRPVDFQPGMSGYACLEVKDTGCGIEKDALENLFDPFYSTRLTGRGLGLPVVLGTLRAYGGCITVESAWGRGSTFRIFLPLTTEKIPVPEAVAEPETMVPEERTTVLLVDDEASIREMGAKMLKRMGKTVLEAGDGFEAVDVFQKHRKDICCVLCDLTMPRMDGWETLEALRRIEPAVPVILVSGYDQALVMKGARSELPQAFLSKPYQLSDLKNALEKALSLPGN